MQAKNRGTKVGGGSSPILGQLLNLEKYTEIFVKRHISEIFLQKQAKQLF